jgi:CcmD family protein
MQSYLVAAYIIAWLGICIYVAVLAMRMRAVRTELAAVEELVREHQESIGSSVNRETVKE